MKRNWVVIMEPEQSWDLQSTSGRPRRAYVVFSPKACTFKPQTELKSRWSINGSGLCEHTWGAPLPGLHPKPHTWFVLFFPFCCSCAGHWEARLWRCCRTVVALTRSFYLMCNVSKKYTFLLFELLHILSFIYNRVSEEWYFLFIQLYVIVGFSFNSEKCSLGIFISTGQYKQLRDYE